MLYSIKNFLKKSKDIIIYLIIFYVVVIFGYVWYKYFFFSKYSIYNTVDQKYQSKTINYWYSDGSYVYNPNNKELETVLASWEDIKEKDIQIQKRTIASIDNICDIKLGCDLRDKNVLEFFRDDNAYSARNWNGDVFSDVSWVLESWFFYDGSWRFEKLGESFSLYKNDEIWYKQSIDGLFIGFVDLSYLWNYIGLVYDWWWAAEYTKIFDFKKKKVVFTTLWASYFVKSSKQVVWLIDVPRGINDDGIGLYISIPWKFPQYKKVAPLAIGDVIFHGEYLYVESYEKWDDYYIDDEEFESWRKSLNMLLLKIHIKSMKIIDKVVL